MPTERVLLGLTKIIARTQSMQAPVYSRLLCMQSAVVMSSLVLTAAACGAAKEKGGMVTRLGVNRQLEETSPPRKKSSPLVPSGHFPCPQKLTSVPLSTVGPHWEQSLASAFISIILSAQAAYLNRRILALLSHRPVSSRVAVFHLIREPPRPVVSHRIPPRPPPAPHSGALGRTPDLLTDGHPALRPSPRFSGYSCPTF